MKAAGGAATDAGRKAFLSVLGSTRFGEEREKNYIFAYDYNGVTLSHVDPEKIGENRFNTVYANGVKMVQRFIEIAKSSIWFWLYRVSDGKRRQRHSNTEAYIRTKLFPRSAASQALAFILTISMLFSIDGYCWMPF